MPENQGIVAQGEEIHNSQQKAVSKPIYDLSKPSVEQARSLILEIRVRSKGQMNFKKISNWCGWSDSRVSQVLHNWDNPRYVSPNSYVKILKKLKECLDSVSGINVKEEKNGIAGAPKSY